MAHWLELDLVATLPANTSVELYVRVGDDLATLAAATPSGPWTVFPADLQAPPGPVPNGRYLMPVVRLISADRVSTPTLHEYTLAWTCP